MTSLEHTILAMVCIGVAYFVGYRMGERAGAIEGIAAMIAWVKEKAGVVQWNAWQFEEEVRQQAEEDANNL
jgi:hypothetical protein